MKQILGNEILAGGVLVGQKKGGFIAFQILVGPRPAEFKGCKIMLVEIESLIRIERGRIKERISE